MTSDTHDRTPTPPNLRTPPALADAPVVAHLVRGGFVESAHRASIAVTAPDGSLERVWGCATDPIFPRSSNKPMQALASLRAGWDPTPEALALACASHSGEPFHLRGVRASLEASGLSEVDLQNTPAYPVDAAERDRWVVTNRPMSSLGQNCSGKHAGMLGACVAAGWPRATYLDPEHPLQRLMADTLAELAHEPITAHAIDGCGAPVMALTLQGLARSFGTLAAASTGLEKRVADAMRTHPEYVGGSDRDVTELMRATPGLIAKDGAEAVVAVGLPDGRGVALKIADGSGGRARFVVLAAVLRRLGVESEAFARLENSPVLGHGEPVGALIAVNL